MEIPVIAEYLNSPEVRELLGVESPNNFSACANDVGRGFNVYMDKYVTPTQHYVAELLERDVRMLIYAGTYDWQCNWVANKLWIEKLDWSGREAFSRTLNEWDTWTVGNTTVGITKTAGPLTFATIAGAGHMMSSFYLLPQVLLANIMLDEITCRMINQLKHLRWCRGGWRRSRFNFLQVFMGNKSHALLVPVILIFSKDVLNNRCKLKSSQLPENAPTLTLFFCTPCQSGIWNARWVKSREALEVPLGAPGISGRREEETDFAETPKP